MKLVKPDKPPQSSPFFQLAGYGACTLLRLRQALSTKPIPMRPIIILTAMSDTTDAVSQPTSTPPTPAGTRIFRLMALKSLR